jgi:CYTH domain-containing protein
MAASEAHRLETTKRIEENVYEEFIKNKDSKRKEVKREIIHIIFQDRIFVIESYETFALVRTTTHTEEEEVSIPDWFGGVVDVTENEKYFSYNLSNPDFTA